jgi:hypothetical protein
MARKTKAELLLERAAEAGSAVAAVQLDRMHARRERERRKPNLTQVRAADRDAKRKAMSDSRSIRLDGPDLPAGGAKRVLDWLAMTDDEQVQHPELTDRVNREHAAWAAEADAYNETHKETA